MHVIKFALAPFIIFIVPTDCTLLGFVKDVVSQSLELEPSSSTTDFESNNIENLEDDFEDHGTRRCYKKLMIEEKMVYDTVETCNHSYDKRCHTTYVTRYEPYQEEECKTQYKKSCYIVSQKQTIQERVEVCRTPLIKNCDESDDNNKECRVVYESECWTKYHQHQVEDDIPECKTIMMEKCDETGKCDTWPQEQCSLSKRNVTKSTPNTGCDKIPRMMCTPVGCQIKEGEVVCREEPRSLMVEVPKEQCDIDPHKYCSPVTKMIPKLVPYQNCVDVPKEICSKSKINPRRIKKPVIKKLCFKTLPSLSENPCEDCSNENNTAVCDIMKYPYTTCQYCSDSKCVPGCLEDKNCPQDYTCYDGVCRSGPGKVLVNSISVKPSSCIDGLNCQSQAFEFKLIGEVIGEFLDGIPCMTNVLNTINANGTIAYFDGRKDDDTEDETERMKMGGCYKAPLNAQLGGGQVRWKGKGAWEGESICVDWRSSNMAWTCELEPIQSEENFWNMVRCRDLTPIQDCRKFYQI